MKNLGTTGPTTSPAAVDADWSINELLRRKPAAVSVLNAYGVDSCCGGDRSLADAAREDGIDLAALLADVEAA